MSIQYTFEKLCPQWSNRLQEISFQPISNAKRKLYSDEIHMFAKCVVGEAHKFSDNYINCEKCLEFANRIALLYTTYRGGLKPVISEFMHHFNEMHHKL